MCLTNLCVAPVLNPFMSSFNGSSLSDVWNFSLHSVHWLTFPSWSSTVSDKSVFVLQKCSRIFLTIELKLMFHVLIHNKYSVVNIITCFAGPTTWGQRSATREALQEVSSPWLLTPEGGREGVREGGREGGWTDRRWVWSNWNDSTVVTVKAGVTSLGCGTSWSCCYRWCRKLYLTMF